jgi:hypothetical protein
MKRGTAMQSNLFKWFLVAIFLLFSSGVSLSEEKKSRALQHDFSVALVSAQFDYHEPGIMKERGLLYGVAGTYTYHYDKRLALAADLEIMSGSLDYDGYYDGSTATTDTDDRLVEFRVIAGYSFAVSGGHLITPYIGNGYRFWNDDILGRGGYERKIEYWYFPVGIKTMSRLSDVWSWGVTIEYDIFWGGEVKSRLSDVFSEWNDPDVNQDFWGGYGARASFRFKRKYAKGQDLFIEPFIRYWDIERSKLGFLIENGVLQRLLWEPENNTTSYGLRLGWEF